MDILDLTKQPKFIYSTLKFERKHKGNLSK